MNEQTKKCPCCNEIIDASASICPICYETLPVDEALNEYTCPYCHEIISPSETECPYCCEALTSSESQPAKIIDKAKKESYSKIITVTIATVCLIILVVAGLLYINQNHTNASDSKQEFVQSSSKMLPSKKQKKYKAEVEKYIDKNVPIVNKSYEKELQEIKDIYNKVKNGNKLTDEEYMNLEDKVEYIDSPEFNFYKDLTNVTAKYFDIQNDIPHTDFLPTLVAFVLPYLKENNVDTSKIKIDEKGYYSKEAQKYFNLIKDIYYKKEVQPPSKMQKPTSKPNVPVPSGVTKVGTYNGIKDVGPSAAAQAEAQWKRMEEEFKQEAEKTRTQTQPTSTYDSSVNSTKLPDFESYMRELQRTVKSNWNPPQGSEGTSAKVRFQVAKDGSLLPYPYISKSSGIPAVDKAAMKAVQLSQPFKPLPADYKGQSIDIDFLFDYKAYRRY